MSDYAACLSKFPQYLSNAWKDLEDGRQFFGDPSHREDGARSMGNIVFVLSLLAAASDGTQPNPLARAVDSEQLLDRARAALSYMTRGHITGDRACADGRRWGGVWQSSWWTTRMALGARHIHSKLSQAEKDSVERVVLHEAELLLSRIVPSGLSTDTKAEENAWETEILATAIAMYPQHPRKELWWEKLCEYAYNTFSVAADRRDFRIVDGRPINEWVYTVNLYSDFSLENHGAYHFCYVASPLHSFAWASYALSSAGIEPPRALLHHVQDVWKFVKPTFLRDRFAHIGGQDWARYTYGNYFILPALIWIASQLEDQDAERMEAARLRCLTEEQHENTDGSFFGRRFTQPYYAGQPAKYETDCYANVGLAYCLRRAIEGDAQRSAVPNDIGLAALSDACLDARIVSQESGVAYGRTRDLFVSFSWKTLAVPYPLALFIPVAREELAEWQPGNLFGRIHLWDKEDSAVWLRSMREVDEGFRIEGTVLYRRRGRNLFTQHLKFSANLDKGYADVQARFVAESRLRVAQVEGLRLAIANDRWNGYRVQLTTETNTVAISFDPQRRPFWMTGNTRAARLAMRFLKKASRDGRRWTLAGRWVNVDNAFGIIALGDNPPPFVIHEPVGRNLRDGSLHFNLLFCPLRFENRRYDAGQEILNSSFRLVAGNSEETRRWAAKTG